jgi:hypothetical protein
MTCRTPHVSVQSQSVHLRVVMETLGHPQVSLTLDTYSHVLPGLQAEAAASMQEAIGCQTSCQDVTERPLTARMRRFPWRKWCQNFASWNLIGALLKKIDELRRTGTGQALATVARFPSR